MTTLKKRLRSGGKTVGSWLAIASDTTVEIMAHAGFDWLVIDMEHAPIGIAEAARMIRIIDLAALPALCRLPGNDPVMIKHVLDAGASGIIVPMVESGEEALRAVAASYYPPAGARGVGLARAQSYGSGFETYRDNMKESILVIAMIESLNGMENVDEIAVTPGIDGLLIGPYDLSASLGIIGQLDHPKMNASLQNIIGAARRAGIWCGLHVVHPNAEAISSAFAEGFTFLAVGVDMIFLDQAAKTAVQESSTSLNHS